MANTPPTLVLVPVCVRLLCDMSAETITERSIVSRGCDSSMRESFRKSTAEASDPILPILAVGTPSTVVQGVSLCQSMFHPTVTLHLLSQGDSGASSSRQHHRVNGAERSLAASSDDPAATHDRDIVLQLAPEPQYVPRSITLEVRGSAEPCSPLPLRWHRFLMK